MSARFNVVVVGAGPAGVSAAYALAQAGFEVAIFERGEAPGAKNMFGGVLYGRVLHDLIPNFWEVAPVERHISRRSLALLSAEAAVSLDFRSESFTRPPFNGFTVSRPRFDQWYAQQAAAAGALLITDTVVDDLLWEEGRVAGVVARREDGAVRANVVIAADGANSLLAQRAGLRSDLQPRDVGLGVKEIIALPRRTIEDRFNLTGDEGAAKEFIGAFSHGVQAGGFIYTNKESLSVGVVANLASLRAHRTGIVELLDGFKAHPAIRGLLDGGAVREYAAHLVPEGGWSAVPRLYGDGILVVGDAAGLVCSTGLALEGANYAITSGLAAAEAVKQAREKGDYSRATLACFEQLLRERFALGDLAMYRRAPALLANPRLYGAYPAAACAFFEHLFTVDGRPKRRARRIAKEVLPSETPLWRLLWDMLEGARAL